MPRRVESVVGGPVKFDGEVVRAVVGTGGKVLMETWRDGSWVPCGDPAAPAIGRPLSTTELSALGIPSSHPDPKNDSEQASPAVTELETERQRLAHHHRR